MNKHVHRVTNGLCYVAWCRYCPMKVPVAFVADQLAFKDTAECVEFLTRFSAILAADQCSIDCKLSLTALTA